MTERFSALRVTKLPSATANGTSSNSSSLASGDGAWARTTSVAPLMTIGNVDQPAPKGNSGILSRSDEGSIAGTHVEPILAWAAPTAEVSLGALSRVLSRRHIFENAETSAKREQRNNEMYAAAMAETTKATPEAEIDLYPSMTSLPISTLHASVTLADAAAEIGTMLRELSAMHILRQKETQKAEAASTEAEPSSAATQLMGKRSPLAANTPKAGALHTAPQASASSSLASPLCVDHGSTTRPFHPPIIEPTMCRIGPPNAALFTGELKYLLRQDGDYEQCVSHCISKASRPHGLPSNPFTSFLASAAKRRLPAKEVGKLLRYLVPPKELMLHAPSGHEEDGVQPPRYHLSHTQLLQLAADVPSAVPTSNYGNRLAAALGGKNPHSRIAAAAALTPKDGSDVGGTMSCRSNWLHLCGLIHSSDRGGTKTTLSALLEVNKDVVADIIILMREVCYHYEAAGWVTEGEGRTLAGEFACAADLHANEQNGTSHEGPSAASTNFYLTLKQALGMIVRDVCTMFPTTEPQCHAIKRLADWDLGAKTHEGHATQGQIPILGPDYFSLLISATTNNLLKVLHEHQGTGRSAHRAHSHGPEDTEPSIEAAEAVVESGPIHSNLTSPPLMSLSVSGEGPALLHLPSVPLPISAANRCVQLFCLLLNNVLLRNLAANSHDKTIGDALSDSHNSTSTPKAASTPDSPMGNSTHSAGKQHTNSITGPHLRSPNKSASSNAYLHRTNVVREESLVEASNFALAFRDLAEARQLFQTLRRLEHGGGIGGGSETSTPKSKR